MSVRHGLLALLDEGPKHGYQLRGEFEQATGGTWPLNIGQVYTTLNRLERDGLVASVGDGPDGGGADRGADGRVRYQVTDEGRAELHRWLATPVGRETRPRDELAIKLALALVVAGADVATIVQAQRTATLQLMRQYTRLKAELPDDDDTTDLSWFLVLDSLIFAAEAEIRWLDHCEGRLARAATRQRRRPADAPPSRQEVLG
jgi:DNA-binding PadR family transcriptional regulator